MKINPNALTATQVAGLLRVSTAKVSLWIKAGTLAAYRTPMNGYQISAHDVVEFLRLRLVVQGHPAWSTINADRLMRRELLTVPEAAAAIGLESAKLLYRAIRLGEFPAFDLSENESRGMRVLVADARCWFFDSGERRTGRGSREATQRQQRQPSASLEVDHAGDRDQWSDFDAARQALSDRIEADTALLRKLDKLIELKRELTPAATRIVRRQRANSTRTSSASNGQANRIE